MAGARQESAGTGLANWTLVGIRNNLTLLVIALYLILNWGFMLVRFPPGGGAAGVPMGEIVLLLFFVSLGDFKWLPHFSRSIFLFPFLVWWTLGIGRALSSVPEHGMWALRDATHVIESLFLWVGFVYAAKPATVDRFFFWLRKILVVASLYGLTYPFRDFLRNFSPSIEGAAGYTTTIIFQYVNSALMMLMEAARRFIGRSGKSGLGTPLIAGFLIAFAVAFFQARTVYLQVIAILILFAWLHRAALGKIWMSLVMATLAFLFVATSGIEISGRLGQVVSLDFLVNHFAAIAGVENEGVVGAARGVGQRLDWWAIIWQRVTSDVGHMLFGLGYGFPLIEFTNNQNTVVREPHNSYMSIFGRMGFVGVLVFSWGHILLLRVWFKAFRLCRRVGHRLGQNRLLLLMVYFVLIWVLSLGEDAFEKPYVTIPYYFFWGIVLRYYQHLRFEIASARNLTASPTHEAWEPVDARPARP